MLSPLEVLVRRFEIELPVIVQEYHVRLQFIRTNNNNFIETVQITNLIAALERYNRSLNKT